MLRVTTADGLLHTYAEGARWRIDDERQLHVYTHIERADGTIERANVSLGSYAPDAWASVRTDGKQEAE